jgi:hypothetical protein
MQSDDGGKCDLAAFVTKDATRIFDCRGTIVEDQNERASVRNDT